jgi:uncharacterized protein (TIGR01370 family)
MTLKMLRRDILAIAAVVGLFIVLCAPSSAQVPPNAASSSDAVRVLAKAESWGYQLQRIKPETLDAIPYDVFVIDYSQDGTDEKALTPADVAALKRKPDGSRRIVLAYLSIGEAEKYRYYWQADWETPGLAPTWLAGPNKRWRTNFPVRYWHPDWQAIVFGGETSYLARIVAAGFDGVYLDRVDAFQEFESENPKTCCSVMAGRSGRTSLHAPPTALNISTACAPIANRCSWSSISTIPRTSRWRASASKSSASCRISPTAS